MEQDEEQLIVAQIALGEKFSEFKQGDVYRYLIERVQAEIREAEQELRTVNAYLPDDVNKLQNKVWRAQSFIEWIDQVISEGDQAYLEYQRREDEDYDNG